MDKVYIELLVANNSERKSTLAYCFTCQSPSHVYEIKNNSMGAKLGRRYHSKN